MSETKRKIRKINIETISILILAAVLIFGFPTACADDFINDMADVILKSGINVIQETINGKGIFGSLFEFVTGDVNKLLSSSAISSIKVIATGIILGISVIHFFEAVDRGQDPVESVFKVLVEFCISTLFLINAEKIMALIAKVGITLVELFGNTNPANNDITAQREALLIAISKKTDGGFFWFVQCFAILSIPWILSLLIDITAKLVIIQLILELAIRRAFAALAITDIYKEGLRSAGTRYFRRYFGAFIKLMVCAFVTTFLPKVLILVSPEAFESVSNAFDYLFTVISINLAAIGVMLKAGSYANDIVGI